MALVEDGDLFDLANSLAGLLQAPVTIEDPDTIVIAYSGGNQDVDEARISTILGRQVPVHYREAIAATGVFERLRTSDEVITVDLPEEHMVARAVIAVRDEGRLAGSIWAAIPGGPSPAQAHMLASAAPLVAVQLRAEASRADRSRRDRANLVSTLIDGGEEAEQLAADRTMVGPWAVVSIRSKSDDAIRQAAGPLTLHLAAIAPTALSAPLDRGINAVLPADSAARILGDFLRRFGARERLAVGLGIPVEQAAELNESRVVADQVAEALVRRGRLGVVATLEDVFADVLVDRLEGFLNLHRRSSPLTRLVEHDRQHETGLVDAVRAFLDTGEISAAAEALSVHPNTVRNRLRRAREQYGVDLTDSGTRLALMIDLRVVRE